LELGGGGEYIYQDVHPHLNESGSMNYWDMQKSFWKTPTGVAIWITSLVVILGGGLLALNLFASPYPIIEHFDAKPILVSPGEPANLSWSVIGASLVEINHGIGQVESKGFRILSPSETTTYTLMALNGTRNRSADVRVMVQT
jgi:hypothetical protein